ncbi:MAG: DNA repair protein RecO [Clostridia bacterium]|nr:DNA repair protein RecO [Clostridia bacterium]
MQTTFRTDAVVVRSAKVGSSDRLLTLLTADRGVIKAYANSAENPKNKLHASCNLFCYGDFLVYDGGKELKIVECELKEIFYDLRVDILTLAMAQYFCELAADLSAGGGENGQEILRLTLNSFYYLSHALLPPALLKPVYELRLISDVGFMPSLVACGNCGAFETDPMYFSPVRGVLRCAECGPADGTYKKICLDAVSAMRQICYADLKQVFALRVSGDALRELSDCSERYLLERAGRQFGTLSFLKTLY